MKKDHASKSMLKILFSCVLSANTNNDESHFQRELYYRRVCAVQYEQMRTVFSLSLFE